MVTHTEIARWMVERLETQVAGDPEPITWGFEDPAKAAGTEVDTADFAHLDYAGLVTRLRARLHAA